MKAAVIGSGVGSLATALRLRALGLEVELFESCPDAGGRARCFTINGHEFDAGPTVITAPWLFDELFALFGEKRSHALEFLPCNPWYRLLFSDNTKLDLVAGVDAQIQEIEKLSPADSCNYRSFLRHSEELYRIGYEKLGSEDFSQFRSMIRAIPNLFRLGCFRSLWSHSARYFTDRRVRQAFSMQPLLVGGNPLTTTAIYGLIHAMERKGGIWFCAGGTRKLVSELIALGERHGITILYDAKIIGLTTSKEMKLISLESRSRTNTTRSHRCDLAVWGGDPQFAQQLLGRKRLSLVERIRKETVQSSMGLFVLYFRTKIRYPEVAHHTIILSSKWESLLAEVFNGRSLPGEPSLYLHRPSATDPRLAEEHGESFYVLAPVPHLGLFDQWEEQKGKFEGVVREILRDRVLPNLDETLEFSSSIDPRYFRDELSSANGSGFSIAPTLSQSAWFRFHNQADKVKNLYFCGAGVHPGGGLPGVVTSAKVVERIILKDYPHLKGRFMMGQPFSSDEELLNQVVV
jgi:phytoene desaturase